MRTLNISEETFEKIKDQIKETEVSSIDSLDSMIGNAYFFRAINFHLVGRVDSVVDIGKSKFLYLVDASWVAESARFMETVDDGVVNENEPIKTGVYLSVEHISDFFPWVHNNLPLAQK